MCIFFFLPSLRLFHSPLSLSCSLYLSLSLSLPLALSPRSVYFSCTSTRLPSSVSQFSIFVLFLQPFRSAALSAFVACTRARVCASSPGFRGWGRPHGPLTGSSGTRSDDIPHRRHYRGLIYESNSLLSGRNRWAIESSPLTSVKTMDDCARR